MDLRRGFKKEADAIALEVRRELSLRPTDPLNPFQLAEHLAIPVIPLSEFAAAAPAMAHHFSHVDRRAFSAITVFHGTERIIVHNDSHSRRRQASNLAHELAHGLLLHPPRRALDGLGCRDWDQVEEEEANWLAGALLVPDGAAISIVQLRLSVAHAATAYGVSEQMMEFRLNVTGARKRVARAARFGRT